MTDPEQPLSRRALREAKPVKSRPSARSKDPVANADDASPSPGVIRGFVARHPRAVVTTALSVTFVLVATGALFAGISVGSANASGPIVQVSATPTPTPRALPTTIAAPSRLRTCSIDSLSLDERLSVLSGSVMNASTSEVLWDRQASTPVRTASVLKVLTAAVALSALGPDYTLTTRVVAGSTPGSVVLVGGGDATLSRLPAGQDSVYPGAPKLSDLALQVVTAYAAANPDAPEITDVVLDSTYWSTADKWDSSWARSEQTIGYHSEVTALQVDGDRDDPRLMTSPRSTDPVARAGEAFAIALADAGNPGGVPSLSVGAAAGNTVLGQVQSQPVKTLIAQMLPNSDNTLAEMLARVSSRAIGLNGSAASLNQTFTGVLNTYGVPTAGISIRDGSGLSDLNAVPPAYTAALFIVINGGGQNLNFITTALPVAGVSGGLASRFTGANAIARGAVAAKTGWIDTSYSLAGIVRAADGSVLTFSFHAVRDGIRSNAREALDTLTTGVFTCGDNLSNN